MVSIDSSIIPAIIIFLSLIIALNYLLFQPLMRIQAQRQMLTAGSLAESRKRLDLYVAQMDRYQAAIRNGRMETYRHQEQVRTEAMKRRADALQQARVRAEQMLKESQDYLSGQIQAAKAQLSTEAQYLASAIATALLRRPA
jgi:F-type H+-transporting ATPase subunit b